MLQSLKTRNVRSRKFPGNCRTCDGSVSAGNGTTVVIVKSDIPGISTGYSTTFSRKTGGKIRHSVIFVSQTSGSSPVFGKKQQSGKKRCQCSATLSFGFAE
jgi:hypothetical protein